MEAKEPAKRLLFSHIPDDQLLGYGVPLEWLEDVKVADEDTVLDLADHLPSEASEALLNWRLVRLRNRHCPRLWGPTHSIIPTLCAVFASCERGRIGRGAGISLGEVDPSSCIRPNWDW